MSSQPKRERLPTLDLSPDDNEELIALCDDQGKAEKKWLGGILLRYGMAHHEEAMAEHNAVAAQRTRKRREKPS